MEPRNDDLEISASRYLEYGQHILFALLLVVGASRAVSTGSATAAPALLAAAGTALWYVLGAVMGRVQRRRLAQTGEPSTTMIADARPRPWASRGGVAWFVGLIACWLGLVWLSPDFSWLAFALSLLAVHMLPTAAALLCVAALTCVVVGVQVAGGAGHPMAQFVGPVIGAVVAVGTGLIYRRILDESEQRRRLVADLVAAQDELITAHDELAAAQREAGVLAERQRLAHDIHDTLAQGFSSILLLARAGLAGTPTPDLLAQIESTAAENLDEARRVVHALRPASLEEAPLPAALGRLVAGLADQTGMSATFDVDGQIPPVGTTGEVALLRVAQSALANVRLHSGATRVAVTLTADPAGLTLDVVDDGRGFDPAHVPVTQGRAGFGLRAMRERLAALGGTLEVDSAPGSGTTLSAHLPTRTPA